MLGTNEFARCNLHVIWKTKRIREQQSSYLLRSENSNPNWVTSRVFVSLRHTFARAAAADHEKNPAVVLSRWTMLEGNKEGSRRVCTDGGKKRARCRETNGAAWKIDYELRLVCSETTFYIDWRCARGRSGMYVYIRETPGSKWCVIKSTSFIMCGSSRVYGFVILRGL